MKLEKHEKFIFHEQKKKKKQKNFKSFSKHPEIMSLSLTI